METSKLEQLLTTNVNYLFLKLMRNLLGWLYRPIINMCSFHGKLIRVMYFDYDTWDDDDDDMADDQLYKLGLDVNRINDADKYLKYNVSDRGSRFKRTQPPTWH